MKHSPYFNRNGDMVVPVDTVEAWLQAMADAAKRPDEFTFLTNLAEQWADDINKTCLIIMEASDK